MHQATATRATPGEGADKGATGTPPEASGSAAAALTNLLQFVRDARKIPLEGVYISDGIPPVPDMLASKIRRGEFVEMGELLLEFWCQKVEDGETNRDKPRKTTPIVIL
jgi:hypothetical protein